MRPLNRFSSDIALRNGAKLAPINAEEQPAATRAARCAICVLGREGRSCSGAEGHGSEPRLCRAAANAGATRLALCPREYHRQRGEAGLAIVRAIMEQSGGAMVLASPIEGESQGFEVRLTF